MVCCLIGGATLAIRRGSETPFVHGRVKTPNASLQAIELNPRCSLLSLCWRFFKCPRADWGYGANSMDVECLACWASINSLALLYNAKDSSSFRSGRWNSGTNPDLAFASANSDSHLPDRRVVE